MSGSAPSCCPADAGFSGRARGEEGAAHRLGPPQRVAERRLEHVGSTSVPGFGGRGALDVVLLSEPEEHADIVAGLSQIGFTDFPYGPSRPALTTSVQLEDREY